MKKTRLVSNTKLQSKSRLKSNTKLKSNGKKIKSKAVQEWAVLRKELYAELEGLGIFSCELNLEGCLGNFANGLCHSLRRRFIKTDTQMREVIRGCSMCHSKIDYEMTADECEKLVREIIKNRENKNA